VTFPEASSVHIAPKLVEHAPPGGTAAPMHAHVGVEVQDAGTGEHVYVPAGTPASGGAIPGGWASQKNPAEHVVVPHANGVDTVQVHPRPACCQVPFEQSHS